MSGGGGEERGAKENAGHSGKHSPAKEGKRVGEGCHSAALLVTQREGLSYTIRVPLGSRTYRGLL